MDAQSDRFLRQRRVAEIGQAGQERLCAAMCALPASAALARTYLERAGVSVVDSADEADVPAESPLEGALVNAVPREVAREAWHALLVVRRVLGLAGGSP
jgi:hypothetical protein